MDDPLVLVPGMMCDARLFGPQIAAFSASRDIHVPHLQAAGGIAEIAARILAAAPPRFALLGLSMGGIMAMEIARQARARVARLALLDTNPLAETAAARAAREPHIARVEAGELHAVMRDDYIPRYGAHDPAIAALCLDMAGALGPAAFVGQSRALQSRADQTDTLRAYDGPALVLCGAEDGLCPPERHCLMRDLLPRAELVVVEGAGHLPVLQRPAPTNAAIAAWLSR